MRLECSECSNPQNIQLTTKTKKNTWQIKWTKLTTRQTAMKK